MKASNTLLKIRIDKTEKDIVSLESYGYKKRSGEASYPHTHNTIVIIPEKKWYWTEKTHFRGTGNLIYDL